MKRYLFWIVEVFIWLLILFLVSGVVFFIKNHHKTNLNTYQIFLPDIDGIIDGSPVKLMGIQVGYVNQINIVGDDVYLKFIITEPKVELPSGTRATVEFSGLGGSKSLELYPPTSNKNITGRLIIPQKPKRISESLGLLNEMFDQIAEIAYVTSSFMSKLGIIRDEEASKKNENYEKMDDFLDLSNDLLDNLQKKSDKISKKIQKKASEINGTNNQEN